MGNSGVSGVVRDETGAGLPGLEVHVRRRSVWATRELGLVVTDDDGAFTLTYPSLNRPNLEIELTDVAGRRLGLGTFRATREAILATSWTVQRAEAVGWVATGEGAFEPTSGNDVEWLIDNEVAWAAVLDGVNAARESIHFMLFFLDVGHTFLRFEAGVQVRHTLEQALRAAAERGVQVRLLLNDFPTQVTDTAGAVERALEDVAGVQTRRFVVKIAPIHAKVLIVDRLDPALAAAYVIGSPFVQDYFSGPDHSLHDPRRGDRRFPQKQLDVPVHDVSLRIRGPAIAALDETFLLHWNHVAPPGDPGLNAGPVPSPAGAATIQVTRTLAGRTFPTLQHGDTTIYESYCRAIASARDYVYLENQYFVLDKITDALIRAVRRNGIELILVTNHIVDIPLYTGWQRGQVQRLLAGLTAEERARVGVFTLWTHEAGLTVGSPSRLGRLFVHSKVAIVDDEWATVGSANIDGVSLTTSDYVRWVNREARSTDVNVSVLGTNLPATLRRRLWAEHLGLDDASMARKPAAGWVGSWSERADAKLASLRTVPATLHPCRALGWPVGDHGVVPDGIEGVDGYLEALGIAPQGSPPSFEPVETFDFYDFETGRWTE